MPLKLVLIFVLFWGLSTHNHAGTYYRLTVPSQSTAYCETMPFYFVDEGKTIQPFVPITVNKNVSITFSNPYFWFWKKPVTGMAIFSPKGLVKPKKISEFQYRYHLPALPAGETYHLRGTLSEPTKSLRICVES